MTPDDHPPEIEDLGEDSVLYDRHRKEYFHVTTVEDGGVGLHQSGTDYYVPHSLYARGRTRGWFREGNSLTPRFPSG